MASRELAKRLAVYLIADFTGRDTDSVLEQVDRCLSAGVTAVQYRNKDALPFDDHLRIAKQLRVATSAHGALFMVNDDLILALESRADGVHLGPNDLGIEEAGRESSDAFIIGGSTGDPAGAADLERAGCSYLGVGAIFDAKASKPDSSTPRGLSVIRSVRAAVSLPLVAIGGITTQNAESVYRSGADGVAVIRSLVDATDPEAVVSLLLAAHRRHHP